MTEQTMTDRELANLCTVIHNMMTANQLDNLNELLRNIKDDDLTDYMIGVLSYSCPFADKLDEWEPARDRITIELVNRGEDVQEVMRGFFDLNHNEASKAWHQIQNLINRRATK